MTINISATAQFGSSALSIEISDTADYIKYFGGCGHPSISCCTIQRKMSLFLITVQIGSIYLKYSGSQCETLMVKMVR